MMVFHNPQRNVSKFLPQLKLDGVNIETVNSFDFLCIILDKHLTWKDHIQKISNRISCSIGVINRLKRFIPQPILKIIYNSMILPYLNYSILTWGTKSKRLQKLQKWAIRTITNSKYNSHCDPLFKKLHLLKIQGVYTLSCLKFYYRYTNKSLPSYFETIFDVTHPPHDYNTRNRLAYHPPISRTSLAKSSIRFRIPHIVKDTGACILEKKNTHSLL